MIIIRWRFFCLLFPSAEKGMVCEATLMLRSRLISYLNGQWLGYWYLCVEYRRVHSDWFSGIRRLSRNKGNTMQRTASIVFFCVIVLYVCSAVLCPAHEAECSEISQLPFPTKERKFEQHIEVEIYTLLNYALIYRISARWCTNQRYRMNKVASVQIQVQCEN